MRPYSQTKKAPVSRGLSLSSEFNYIAFDEATHFTRTQYLYLFSRLRRPEGYPVPLRMRAASNPGGIGHEWVYDRIIVEGPSARHVFVPARLDDNPHLDRAAYVRSLERLDPVTRAQLLHGDWTVRQQGPMFKREWFSVIEIPPAGIRWVRWWDLAASAPKPGRAPDYTAGVKIGLKDGVWYIADVRRTRERPKQVEDLVRLTAELDGRGVAIRMEQEPGSSGVAVIDHFRRAVLVGFDFRGERSTGSKLENAPPLSSAAEAGNVKLVGGARNGAFLDEVEEFPPGRLQ